jgi:uncharacterized membrane protein
MIVGITTVGYIALIVPEARIVVLAEARFVLASPFPIFPLAITVQPVVLNVVVPAHGKPLPVIWVVISVIAAISAVSVWIVSITVL